MSLQRQPTTPDDASEARRAEALHRSASGATRGCNGPCTVTRSFGPRNWSSPASCTWTSVPNSAHSTVKRDGRRRADCRCGCVPGGLDEVGMDSQTRPSFSGRSQPSDGAGFDTHRGVVVFALLADTVRGGHRKRTANDDPAPGNIDVLLAPVRSPISGGAVRMVMCSPNVKPRTLLGATGRHSNTVKCAIQGRAGPSHTGADQPPDNPCPLDGVLHRRTRK